MEFANNHETLRAWAIEGTGGHGAGLSRHPLRDDQHRGGAARLGSSRARDVKEPRELQQAIVVIIRGWRPDLLEEFGVGPIAAATVLCAWSHPGRVHSEAAFAMLAGVARIPANSGQDTTRYRLNRYGDRHLNTALHTVVQIRTKYQPSTRDYVARRTAEGKTGREIKTEHDAAARPVPSRRGHGCDGRAVWRDDERL